MYNIKAFKLKLYLGQFFMFFIPFLHYRPLFIEDNGMNPFQISLIITAPQIGNFLFGIPSSIIADKYSRKNVIVCGLLICALSTFSIIIFRSFSMLFLIFFLFGVGRSLYSGTFEALIYDELKNYGQEKKYQKIYGMAEIIRSLGAATAGFGAGFLIKFGYETLITIEALALLLSALLYFSVKEVRRQQDISIHKNYFDLLKEGFKHSFKIKELFILILFSASLMMFAGIIDNHISIVIRETGWASSAVGIFAGCMVFGNAIAKLIGRHSSVGLNITIFICLLAIVLQLIGSFTYTASSPILIFIIMNTTSFSRIVLGSRLQELTHSNIRATVTSVQNFLKQALTFLLLPIFGLIAKIFDYRTAFISLGSLAFIMAIGILIWHKMILKKSGQPEI